MKFLYRLKFQTQMTVCFAIVISFVLLATLGMLNAILRGSFHDRQSQTLQTQGRQLAINIDNRFEYYLSYLRLLSRDKNLLKAMSEDDFWHVNDTLSKTTEEFMKLNAGRVSCIRMYRNGVYTSSDGLVSSEEIMSAFEPNGIVYPKSVLTTGTYLNDRNEKVFSIFLRVYQTNPKRDYFIEMCIYETELYGFFNEDNSGNGIYVINEGRLMSMNERQTFSSLLYGQKSSGESAVEKSQLKIPKTAVVISAKGASGVEILIKTSTKYLDRDYLQMLIQMLPVLFAVLLLAIWFAKSLSTTMNYRLKALQEKIADISNWNLKNSIHIEGNDEFAELACELDFTRERILELINQNNSINELMRVSEMSALRAQINSHFLFNSLSTIKWLAREKQQEKLSAAVDSLALFLRYSLAIDENQVLLSGEVKQLEAYTSLQSMRYEKEVNVQIDVDEELMQCKTVRLILQPLVENAIYHGRRASGELLNITVYSYYDDSYYYLVVEDDGNGISESILNGIRQRKENLSQSGYGLKNVMDRVQMCLGGENDENFIIESVLGQYTSVTIRQPR